MKIGDQVTVPFAKGSMEGVVIRINEKNVWLKVDFPRHPGKQIRRKIHELKAAGKRSQKRARAPKKKEPQSP